MTKEQFIDEIVDAIDNNDLSFANANMTTAEILANMLDCMEPRNRENFAKWGQPHQQSTPKDCWE